MNLCRIMGVNEFHLHAAFGILPFRGRIVSSHLPPTGHTPMVIHRILDHADGAELVLQPSRCGHNTLG